MSDTSQKIADILGYTFKDASLLKTALTHRSAHQNHNERLEFLGDAILSAVISRALYLKFSNAAEGQLSRLRSSLVCGDTLAEIANEKTLGQFLILGSGERKSGGNRRVSTLADAVEALIGAIFLDADFATAETIVLSWFDERLKNLDLTATNKDFKTQLQEVLQANKFELPKYELAEVRGEAHEQEFEVQCTVSAMKLSTSGTGTSRRRAEQVAAQKMLDNLPKDMTNRYRRSHR